MQKEMENIGQQAKEASVILADTSTTEKNKALAMMADALIKETDCILKANAKDMEAARKSGLSQAMLDRLLLTDKRIADMAEGLRQIAALPDPIGEILSGHRAENGLVIEKIRVPFGVIGIIYEARPNVTSDAAGLCLKTGNAAILRGGSEAIKSNKAVAKVLSYAIKKAGLPENSVQLVETTERKAVDILLRMKSFIDVIIPRGGAELIKKVAENSSVPVIETGTGVCHVFVDESADIDMASSIAYNAKVSRPSVCNAMETLLVHQNIAQVFLPGALKRLSDAKVELVGCDRAIAIYPEMQKASEEDWSTEYSDLKLSVKVVDDIDEAIGHISKYGTKHSEAIITEKYYNARYFQRRVDAATVYVNASTRFTDGFEFGFGAEIGISTQKLHARGPMGLVELTSTKYLINGDGQIR